MGQFKEEYQSSDNDHLFQSTQTAKVVQQELQRQRQKEQEENDSIKHYRQFLLFLMLMLCLIMLCIFGLQIKVVFQITDLINSIQSYFN